MLILLRFKGHVAELLDATTHVHCMEILAVISNDSDTMRQEMYPIEKEPTMDTK